jgi:Ni,Fe-hydrogenase III component G
MIELKKVDLKDFETEIKRMRGKRLITITCIPREKDFELLYHFDGEKIETMQIFATKNKKICDIADMFAAAKIYEEDIQESYGLDFGLPKKRLFAPEVD